MGKLVTTVLENVVQAGDSYKQFSDLLLCWNRTFSTEGTKCYLNMRGMQFFPLLPTISTLRDEVKNLRLIIVTLVWVPSEHAFFFCGTRTQC